ncbi:hypothetical protein [Paenibacillus hemerocallicola]|uniref:hypothetical protein n=1 Tax=Paenibacillus hemerocallicola TaxID=1172614 RepID=UPI00159ECB52|nr:hypothetical protein [Paenibacillus hemerocallicola]
MAGLVQLGGQLHTFLQTRENAAPIEAFALLDRLLQEQTTEGEGKLELKTPGELDSGRLQNPSDPDATHRVKGGKGSTGYSYPAEENGVQHPVYRKQATIASARPVRQPDRATDGEFPCEDRLADEARDRLTGCSYAIWSRSC